MEIHEEKVLVTFSFEGPKHVMFGRAYMLWDLTGPASTHHDEPKSQHSPCSNQIKPYNPKYPAHMHASLGSGAPATTRHRVTIQNGHRTTHTRTPTFKNAARTTTKHHIPIQNDHSATRTHTPSFKMQPAPQRNTTLRFKMATAPHAHARPASKCSPHHNGTPRYDRKWPPRHTETLDHNVALAV